MDEFTMSAVARHVDGSRTDAFAEVWGKTVVACFAAMAAEVTRWLPIALSAGRDEIPEAIEITLTWGGDAASLAAAVQSQGPRDVGGLEVHPERVEVPPAPRRGSSCAALPRALPPPRRRTGLPVVGVTRVRLQGA